MRKYLYISCLAFIVGLFLVVGERFNLFMHADSTLGPQVGHLMGLATKIGIACITAGLFGFTGMIILGLRK